MVVIAVNEKKNELKKFHCNLEASQSESLEFENSDQLSSICVRLLTFFNKFSNSVESSPSKLSKI